VAVIENLKGLRHETCQVDLNFSQYSGLQTTILQEHMRERARAIALVRFILCVVNFAVLYLDFSVPREATASAYLYATIAAVAFLFYAGALLWLAGRKNETPAAHFVWSAILDIGFSAALIVTTDGYMSPFNLWLVFSVVASAFGPYSILPLVTTVLGVIAHIVIATIPQHQPLDPSVFAVRTGYLFGFAALLAYFGSYVNLQTKGWSILEWAGAQLSVSFQENEVAEVVVRAAKEFAPKSRGEALLSDRVPSVEAEEPSPESARCYEFPLVNMRQEFGKIRIYLPKAPNRTTRAFFHILADRTASALSRISTTKKWVMVVSKEERLVLADEVHDDYLQTLAALNLQIEAASRRLSRSKAAIGELAELKELVNLASMALRKSGVFEEERAPVGPDRIRENILKRWPENADISLPLSSALSPEAWLAAELIVNEGLRNAKRHGKARCVEVKIECDEEGAMITIQDDGVGLKEPIQTGYGLNRIESIVKQLGGQMVLKSLPRNGAILIVRLGQQKIS
jgi:signal transduction histidine kinase